MAGKEEATEKKKQKTVTGTDADLRKLLLKDGRDVLRRFNVPEEEVGERTRFFLRSTYFDDTSLDSEAVALGSRRRRSGHVYASGKAGRRR